LLVRGISEHRIEVGMRFKVLVVIVVACVHLTAALRAQSAVAIHAAATSPVSGWQQMASPDSGLLLWVAPTNDLTSSDIERAESVMASDGSPALEIVFTGDGAKKMAALSTTRLGQPIAFLVDGKLIWAPVVRAPIDGAALLSSGRDGLPLVEIQRLLAIFNRR
jgi:preprotein translocase subunit SecD